MNEPCPKCGEYHNNCFELAELTDEEMEKIFYESHFNEDCDVRDFIEFARAILRKAQENG